MYLAEFVGDQHQGSRRSHSGSILPGYPFLKGEIVLVLGEIAQMPGHVAVAPTDGPIQWGYHAENFRRLKEDEA